MELFAIGNEYGSNHKSVSRIEHQYCSLMNYKYPEEKFIYAFSNPSGPKYFPECIPDLYSPITKIAYFFNGCYFHAHYDNCTINKDAKADTMHPFGKTFAEMNQIFFAKIEKLMKNHPEISKVNIQWECNFKKIMKERENRLFFEHYYLSHCLHRLKPRDCIRGAFSDMYALKWKLDENEKFFCTDVNGLYSFCAINFPYMIGKYEVLIGNSLNNLTIRNNKFLFKDNFVMGSILLKILPPKNLFAPFLLYRTKKGSVVNTLCKMCAELNSKNCKHSEDERSLIASYMISEIEFALSLGYRILQIYETHIYLKNEFILKDFIQKINYYKTIATDCFKDKSLREQILMCSQLNDKMQLDDPNFQISPENFKPNNAQRNYYKLLCNALFGKFIQRRDQTDIIFVKSQEELSNLYFGGNVIEDFLCPNENVCMVFVKKNILKLPPNRKQNIYIGSQITAYAREVIYRHLQSILLLKDYKIYHVECDSIYFSGPTDKPCPLPLTTAVGDFKLEYTNILNFYGFGPKHYCLNYLDENGQCKNVCKYSGLSLTNDFNARVINETTFEKFLNDFINQTESAIELNQKIIKSDFKRLHSYGQVQKFTFRNKISQRRFVDNTDSHMTTFPYGYSEK